MSKLVVLFSRFTWTQEAQLYFLFTVLSNGGRWKLLFHFPTAITMSETGNFISHWIEEYIALESITHLFLSVLRAVVVIFQTYSNPICVLIARFPVAFVHLPQSYDDRYCSSYKLSLFNFKLTVCKREEAVFSRLQCRCPKRNATTPRKVSCDSSSHSVPVVRWHVERNNNSHWDASYSLRNSYWATATSLMRGCTIRK